MGYEKLARVYNGSLPRAAAGRKLGRMTVSGKNILDPNGNKWTMRGFVYGQVGLYQPGDCAQDAAMGANTVRIMYRAWGGGSYSFPNLDGELPGAWGNNDPTYFYATSNAKAIEVQIMAARAAGLRVLLAFDSNCGQNGNQAGMAAGCTLLGVPGRNFYTTEGAGKRAEHIARIRTCVRKWYGMVDFIEPVVEPNPGATGHTIADVNQLTREVMLAVMQEDPDMIFVLGGFSYQHGKIQDPMSTITYPTGNIVLTCDLLDNIMTAPDFADAVGDMVQARNKQNLPVICQQVGTLFSSEVGPTGNVHDSDILAAGLELLRNPAGNGSEASIGWTFWEKISKGINQYGPWWDSSNDGNNRQLGSQTRVNVLTAALQAAPIVT